MIQNKSEKEQLEQKLASMQTKESEGSRFAGVLRMIAIALILGGVGGLATVMLSNSTSSVRAPQTLTD